jgi:hypothetical protein
LYLNSNLLFSFHWKTKKNFEINKNLWMKKSSYHNLNIICWKSWIHFCLNLININNFFRYLILITYSICIQWWMISLQTDLIIPLIAHRFVVNLNDKLNFLLF